MTFAERLYGLHSLLGLDITTVNKAIVFTFWMALICQTCADQMAHLIPKLDAHFLCHSGCHGHGSHPARLCATYLFAFSRVALMQKQVQRQISIYSANTESNKVL